VLVHIIGDAFRCVDDLDVSQFINGCNLFTSLIASMKSINFEDYSLAPIISRVYVFLFCFDTLDASMLSVHIITPMWRCT
jgi:hypothetical protein